MLESKRRWARKKRLQEKQAAQGIKSGENTPMPDGSDYEGEDCDDGADADVSSMSFSLSRGTDDDSFSMPNADANRRASVKIEESAPWSTSPDGSFFASQDEAGRPAKRQALAPSTAHNIAGPSSASAQYPSQMPSGPYGAQDLAAAGGNMYSNSPMRRTGLTLAPVAQGAGLPMASHPNDSFSSNSSEYSQPGSASFFNDSFGANMSHSGSETANTSIDTPATTWPSLPPIDEATDNKAAMGRAVEALQWLRRSTMLSLVRRRATLATPPFSCWRFDLGPTRQRMIGDELATP